MVSFNEAVAVVAVDCIGNLILTKQYRHSYNKELIEIAASAFEKMKRMDLLLPKENFERKPDMYLMNVCIFGRQSRVHQSLEIICISILQKTAEKLVISS